MARRGRWERLYTDDGECLRDHTTGLEVIVKKRYGNDAWDVTVEDPRIHTKWRDPEKLRVLHSVTLTRRPKRAELAVIVDKAQADRDAKEYRRIHGHFPGEA